MSFGASSGRHRRTVKKFFRNHASTLDYIADALNCFPTQIAASLPYLAMDSHTASGCHPLLLDTLQPVQTTGDDNCTFNAIPDWQRAVCTTPWTPCCTSIHERLEYYITRQPNNILMLRSTTQGLHKLCVEQHSTLSFTELPFESPRIPI